MNTELIAEVLMNSVLLIPIALVTSFIYRQYIVRTNILRIRFRAFEIRDRLHTLAVNGQVLEDNEAYVYLEGLLNEIIRNCDDISFLQMARSVAQLASAEEDIRHRNLMEKELDRSPSMLEIYSGCLGLTLDSLFQNSLLIRLILASMFLVTRSVKGLKFFSDLASSVTKINNRIEDCQNTFPAFGVTV